jgi:hypothetical protein
VTLGSDQVDQDLHSVDALGPHRRPKRLKRPRSTLTARFDLNRAKKGIQTQCPLSSMTRNAKRSQLQYGQAGRYRLAIERVSKKPGVIQFAISEIVQQ